MILAAGVGSRLDPLTRALPKPMAPIANKPVIEHIIRLLARHGFDVTLGDISSPLLEFCRWRLTQRGLPATYLDLKSASLPPERFDLITAMDVFEHLADPVATVDSLWQALKPGGVLFGRFAAEPDAERPMHIVEDFEPTFARLRALGCVEVWRDEWLWGHQAFQKTP